MLHDKTITVKLDKYLEVCSKASMFDVIADIIKTRQDDDLGIEEIDLSDLEDFDEYLEESED